MPRWEFLPLALTYQMGTALRNKLFDWKLLTSKKYPIPVIGIGNLSTGGTGKSPQTIYLIDLLKNDNEVAMISRGYGRLTKGMQIANYDSTYLEIGDEPLQVFERFRNKILVIVSEKRTAAIENALKYYKTNLVILDDSFQHRHVNPGLKILLTAQDDLYIDDHVLPVGNLRESRSNAKRADIIIVTKCSPKISDEQKNEIKEKLQLKLHQQLFFSSIKYSDKIINRNSEIHLEELENYNVLLITGIANAEPLEGFLENYAKELEHKEFKDHHRYSEKDIKQIIEKFREFKGDKVMITTEKDFMRLRKFPELENYLYYLPIDVEIDEKEKFNELIQDYVKGNHSGD